MVWKTASRLIDTPRRAVGFTRASVAAGEDAARHLRRAAQRFEGAISDVQAMRQVAERLEARVAQLQLQVDSFNALIQHVDSVLNTVADDVEKGTDRLPDPDAGAIHKLKSVLSASTEPDEPQ